MLSQAGELFKQGEEFRDNTALASAISLDRQCLALPPRERVPLQWAATQNNLGTALWRLG